MKTQKEMFYQAHDSTMGAIHFKALILITDKAYDDVKNGLPVRYPKNSDYVSAYEQAIKYQLYGINK